MIPKIIRSSTNRRQTQQESERNAEIWMNKYFLPASMVIYLIICFFDFLLAPVLIGIYSLHFQDHTIQSWNPLTLQGGGLFHVSFGAILSIGKWGHSKERISVSANQSTDTSTKV